MFLQIVIAIVCLLAYMIAYFTASRDLIEKCLVSLPMIVAILVLLIPPFNAIGFIMLVICGILLAFGGCNSPLVYKSTSYGKSISKFSYN